MNCEWIDIYVDDSAMLIFKCTNDNKSAVEGDRINGWCTCHCRVIQDGNGMEIPKWILNTDFDKRSLSSKGPYIASLGNIYD